MKEAKNGMGLQSSVSIQFKDDFFQCDENQSSQSFISNNSSRTTKRENNDHFFSPLTNFEKNVEMQQSLDSFNSDTIATQAFTKTKDQYGRTIINGKYKILYTLGKGGYAKVKLAILIQDCPIEDYSSQYYALKVFSKPFLKKKRILKSECIGQNKAHHKQKRQMQFITALDEVYMEIEIMKKMNHPNLMRVFEVIDCPFSDKIYIVMPVADYGQSMTFDSSTLRFIPYHKLQSKYISSILKSRKKESNYYDESEIQRIASQIVDSLDYLHNTLNIVH